MEANERNEGGCNNKQESMDACVFSNSLHNNTKEKRQMRKSY